MTDRPPDGRPAPSIAYGQCWEDADVLLGGLEVGPGHECLSIASAGDNTLALLLGDPERVVAVDANPAQIACLALRIAAFRVLEYDEVLELIGSRPSRRREALYQRCRASLPAEARAFWDARSELVTAGLGEAGRLERYFRIFRSMALPLVHSRGRVSQLVRGPADPGAFYETTWNSWRWRLLFRVFFSRQVMAALGRRRSHFRFVRGRIADTLLARTEHALARQQPGDNPYLHWLLTGHHGDALPAYLRRENFERIRSRLDRIELFTGTLEDALTRSAERFDRFNLSDVFEYMSDDAHRRLLERLLARATPRARFLYWNLFVPRSRPDTLAARLRPLRDLSEALKARDRVFFYERVVVEEFVG